jgi:hypothetical protein
MAFIVLFIVFVDIPFALLTAFKAKRMRQSFIGWLLAALAMPLISLAVVQYFEPTRAERKARS